MSDWNSALYLKFENERTRAASDLLARVPRFETKMIFDLGCGPGNSTELLAQAFPEAKLVGVDYSANMLSVARNRVPRAEFLKQDIESWRPTEQADLIFANASLHFLPDHHRRLMAAGLRQLVRSISQKKARQQSSGDGLAAALAAGLERPNRQSYAATQYIS
jgi:trans-aconitate methyltransferase